LQKQKTPPSLDEKVVSKSPVNNIGTEEAHRGNGVEASDINTPADVVFGSRQQSSSIGIDSSSQELISPSASSPDLVRNRNMNSGALHSMGLQPHI